MPASPFYWGRPPTWEVSGYGLAARSSSQRASTIRLAGAMGVHMVNPDLLDGVLDPLKPEALVHERKSDGSLKLAAVEYVAFKSAHPAQPKLLGMPFDSNMGSRFFKPPNPFWALHAVGLEGEPQHAGRNVQPVESSRQLLT